MDPTLRAAVLASVQEALGQLLAKRQEEGMAMQQVLRDQLDQMTQALVIAKAEAASVPQALKMRLEKIYRLCRRATLIQIDSRKKLRCWQPRRM